MEERAAAGKRAAAKNGAATEASATKVEPVWAVEIEPEPSKLYTRSIYRQLALRGRPTSSDHLQWTT